MDYIAQLKSKFKMQSVLGQLIVVIISITLLAWLLRFLYLPAYDLLMLPSGLWQTLLQPWSIITYGFVHLSIFHLFWNMIILYSFGLMMLNLFTSRQFFSLFFGGIIAGASVYLIGESLITSLINSSGLIGASAGVYAIAIFVCSYQPDNEVRFFFFNIKLKYIGYFFLGVTLLGLLSGDNMGGNLAHLGGLAVGWYAGSQMRDGNDVLTGMGKLIDFVSSIFASKKSTAKKSTMNTVHRKPKSQQFHKSSKTKQQQQIDAILDKISASGYDSLSKAEKDFLFRAGKD